MLFFLIVLAILVVVFLLIRKSSDTKGDVKRTSEPLKPLESEILWQEQVGNELEKYQINKTFSVWYEAVTPSDKYNLGIAIHQKCILLYPEYKANQYSFTMRIIPFDSIIDCEIVENGAVVTQSGVGRAVIGGIIAGGTGAIVGAATRKTNDYLTELSVRIITNDILNPMVNLYITFRGAKTKKTECTQFYAKAQEIYSTIVSIINQNNS